VAQDPHAGDDPAQVHAQQRDHRLAGVGRDVDDVGRQEHVADQFFPSRVAAVGLDIARPALAVREAVGTGEHVVARCMRAQVRVGRQLCGSGDS